MDLRWLIPLIGVAVWIISQIASNQREAARRLPRPQPPRLPDEFPESDNPRPQQKTSTELDRFLEEVRRRQQAPPRAEPVQSRPHAPGAEPARPKKAPPPPTPAYRPIQIRSIPSAEPVVAAASTSPQPPPPVPAVAAIVPVSKTPAPAAITQVQNLLRQRRSLASAMILREIFDRPVSQRRRRR